MKPEELLLSFKKLSQEIIAKKSEIAEQLNEITALENSMSAIKDQLREVLPQDATAEIPGFKSYWQARNSISYDPIQFAEAFPKLVEFVSETIINKDKIKGLIKGKILTEEQLEVCADKKTTYAFYLDMVDYSPSPDGIEQYEEATN